MKKIFPFYKGKNIANNPLGYTTKECAKKRMNKEDLLKDFRKTLTADFIFNHVYTHSISKQEKNLTEMWVGHRRINVYTWDYDSPEVYIKDMEGEAKELAAELLLYQTKLEEQGFYHEMISPDGITNEESEKAAEISLRLNELGYYPFFYKDENFTRNAFQKFVNENVEYKTMNVEITLTEA